MIIYDVTNCETVNYLYLQEGNVCTMVNIGLEKIKRNTEKNTLPVEEKEVIFQWFVMRDLKRSNAKLPAYKMLSDLNFEVFTPMIWKVIDIKGKKTLKEVPFMPSLLFVRAIKNLLDEIVVKETTLQYCFVRDGRRSPMTVRDNEMQRFIQAVKSTTNPHIYTPEEITRDMIGKRVRIIGGPLNSYEGRLQKLQGSRVKRLFVELPGLFIAAVEVQPEFIQVIKD